MSPVPPHARFRSALHAVVWAGCALLSASGPTAAASGDASRKPMQPAEETAEPTPPPAAAPAPVPEAAPAPAAPEGGLATRPVPVVLQVTWRTADLAAGAAQVSAWVSARQGFSVAVNEHHLSVRLPAAEMPAFLAQFASNQADLPPVDPASPLWITVSLELTAAP